MISIEQKPEYFTFIEDLLGTKYDPKQCVCIASLRADGSILGVVLFDRFTKTGVELSVASISPRFLNRDFLDVIFHYAFVTCKKKRITAVCEDDNEKAISLNKGLGFIEEGRLKCWYGNKDGIILRMLREECRWIKGQKNVDNHEVH